jgi:hypothetical protein
VEDEEQYSLSEINARNNFANFKALIEQIRFAFIDPNILVNQIMPLGNNFLSEKLTF